jgi:flavorubredoxin
MSKALTYTEQLSADFHVAIEEMCRVASEARMFPLLKSYGGPSQHLEPVMGELRNCGYSAAIREVPYEFQRGEDQMLTVTKSRGMAVD